ncbi:hypothetical protein [Sutcliffiella halmapala]|uniref:hypothetical protein n=1 Tax=Sutcliffiella halmapala TaxID=79882 RepID=UPI000994B6B7|nr:hypothetical protein [Sutcliffiella halmapala]
MQKAFWGLLRKEWLVSKHSFLMMTLTLGVLWLIGLGLSIYYNEPSISTVVVGVILFFHVFYLSIYLLGGLMMEGKTQLWLHTPQSTLSLLLSKVVTGLYLTIISFSIFSVVLVIVSEPFTGGSDIALTSLLFLGGLVILVNGLELALYLMFYWGIYHTIGAFHHLRKYRVVCFFLFLIICHSLIVYLGSTTLLTTITSFLPLPIETSNALSFNLDNQGGSVDIETDQLTIGSILIFLVKSTGLLFMTAWLLERIVEVK